MPRLSTTVLCEDCQEICYTLRRGEPFDWHCRYCLRKFRLAPWTYQELIGAIGLETLYQEARNALLAHIRQLLTRADFLGTLQMRSMLPESVIRALQGGATVGPLMGVVTGRPITPEQARRIQIAHN